MKRLLILILFLAIVGVGYIQPLPIQAQPLETSAARRTNLTGIIYLDKNITITMNAEVVTYLTAHLKDIESIDGETIINVPIERSYKKNRRSMYIQGYFCQYEWTNYAGGYDITFDKIKTTYLEFDLVKDKITKKNKNDDDGMFDKPEKLKEKLKEKDKEHSHQLRKAGK